MKPSLSSSRGLNHRGLRIPSKRQSRLDSAVVEALEQRALLSVSLTVSSAPLPTAPSDVVLADINGDGKLDLIAAQSNGTVSIALGNGTGAFGAPTTLTDGLSSNAPAEVMVGNFNGHPDLVLQDGTSVSVMLGNGSGINGTQALLTLPGGDSPRSLTTGDFNGDGSVDLVVGDQNGDVIVFLGNGDGTFQTPKVTASVAANAINGVEESVFKAGDKADLVVGAADGSVKVLLGNGDGTFAAPSSLITVGSGLLFRLARGDLNGDGKQDIVVTQQNGTIDVFLGNGTGTFKAPVVTHLAFNVDGFTHLADMNGDGKTDLVITEPTGNDVEILPGNGNGTFKTAQTVSVSPNIPNTLAVGDLTGQGLMDVVTSTATAEALVLLNTSAPGFTSPAAGTFTTGTSGTFNITTTGTHGTIITSTGTLPSGVTFTNGNDGTAKLHGVPAATAGATYHLTLTSTNSTTSGNNAVQFFTLTVNQAPKITNTSHVIAFDTGSNKTFTVTTSGFPAAAITESPALPSGISFVDNGTGTGTLKGIPAFGDGGQYTLTFTATNSVSAVSQTFTLNVGQPPTITSANTFAFTAGTSGTFPVTATGFPSPTFTETGALPSGITLSKGNLIGTPSKTSGGNYNITLTASNGLAPIATQLFTLVVEQAPAITSPNHLTLIAGNFGSIQVTFSGNPTAPFLVAHHGTPFSATLPSGVGINLGDLSIDGDTGIFGGTPPAGSGGVYTITLTANNLINTANQTFTLTIDQAPEFTGSTATTFTVGTHGSFGIATTGFPAPTIIETGALPAGVTFTDTAAQGPLFSGTPAAGTSGIYNVTLSASNVVLSKAVETFTLTVDGPPKIVSANKVTFGLNNPGTFQILTTGVPAPTSYLSSALPSGLSLDSSTGALTGTPTATGAFVVTFTVSNTIGVAATQVFTLMVVQN